MENKNSNNQIQVVEPNQVTYAEIESQIATAKKYPRNITKFKDKLMSMANLDQSTAEGCYYAVPRAGRSISGPSIRFAEIALSCYGNAVAQADVVGEDEKYIYAMGMCRDLENNVAVRMKIRRRITNKDGHRYNDDMIATTANAACAIALRNVIFKIVPAAFIKEAFDKVKETAVGKAESFADRRAEVVLRLGKMGVDEERTLSVLQKPSMDDLTINDVAVLIGLGTAIHDGETTLDEAFPKPDDKKAGVNGLKERLQNSNGDKPTATDPALEAKKKKAKADLKAAEKKAKEKNADVKKSKPQETDSTPPTEETEAENTKSLYICQNPKCGHEFDDPELSGSGKDEDLNVLCPKCLSKNIILREELEKVA